MIGSRIRRLRTQNGLSQQGLANKTGISKGRIGRIERENVSLTLSEMEIIANKFNISVEELLRV